MQLSKKRFEIIGGGESSLGRYIQGNVDDFNNSLPY